MRCLKIILLLLLTSTFTGVSGQFLKKLKKQVQDATEDAIINTTADKVAEKTAKSLDKLFEVEFGGNAPTPSEDQSSALEHLPESYAFQWKYRIEMESKQIKEKSGKVEILYYFKPGASYWGSEYTIEQAQNMFMVYDGSTDNMIMFMDQQGQKIAMAMNFPEIPVENEDQGEFTMTEIEGKNILGYSCKGYKFENDAYEFTTYVTFETNVSFSDIYGKSQYMPKGFDSNWLKENDKEGMVMEMHMTDKNKSKNNMTMRCTELTEEPFDFATTGYESMGGMGK